MYKRKVSNSYYSKQNNKRRIIGLGTNNPYLEPHKYELIEKTLFGSVTSYDYDFDGQVFTRGKENGGNGKSSWAISGNGLTKKDIEINKKEFITFKGVFKAVAAVNTPGSSSNLIYIADLPELENMISRL